MPTYDITMQVDAWRMGIRVFPAREGALPSTRQ